MSWDDDVPDSIKRLWVTILRKVKEAESVTFKRCVRPKNAIGKPILIICSDASEQAICATAHILWECDDGNVNYRLWAAKPRVAPLKKMRIPQLEAQGGVLCVRLSDSVQKNSIWEFEYVYHIVDSECLLAILRKDSSALHAFMGNQ